MAKSSGVASVRRVAVVLIVAAGTGGATAWADPAFTGLAPAQWDQLLATLHYLPVKFVPVWLPPCTITIGQGCVCFTGI